MTDRQVDDRARAAGPTAGTAGEGAADSTADVPDPTTWRTGDEPPTDRQAGYLETLAKEAGADVPEDITKAEASVRIDELREQTGRT